MDGKTPHKSKIIDSATPEQAFNLHKKQEIFDAARLRQDFKTREKVIRNSCEYFQGDFWVFLRQTQVELSTHRH